ncbi:MAG: FAD-dependent oxidoreductase [Dethiobacteria bacterium]
MAKVIFNSWFKELGDFRNDGKNEAPDLQKFNLPETVGEDQIRAIIGWGGVLLVDDTLDIVESMKAYFKYVNEESCGRCTPCRVGSKTILAILTSIINGEGNENDLVLLEKLGCLARDASHCELGRTAPIALLQSLEHFRDAYLKRIQDEKKTAGATYNYKTIFATPCVNGCPARVKIPDYIGFCDEGRCAEALDVIYEKTPLAGILGRICVHPCEDNCRRQNQDEAVSIRALKRFIADFDDLEMGYTPEIKQEAKKDKKVAIIGSGPAGLNAAYQLAKKGYGVTIFEALPVAGGMLHVGIPSYRLPRNILQKEIKIIEDMGIEFKLNTRIGKDVMFEDLTKEYDAVLVACGLHENTAMGVDGEDAGYKGFMPGVHFLRQMNLGQPVELGEKVAVIGGGNVAMDCARSALRLGAKEVNLIYRRSRAEMPANVSEIEDAEAEGIKFHFLTNPSKIIAENGKVTGMECLKMELGEPDESGRRRPLPIQDSEFILAADTVIPAIGQKGDFSFLPADIKFSNVIEVDPMLLTTSANKVFACGDAVLGARTVVEAVASSNKAATAIDHYLTKGEIQASEDDYLQSIIDVLGTYNPNEDIGVVGKRYRGTETILPLPERVGNFNEVELGLETSVAIEEANRCMQCRRLVLVVT